MRDCINLLLVILAVLIIVPNTKVKSILVPLVVLSFAIIILIKGGT